MLMWKFHRSEIFNRHLHWLKKCHMVSRPFQKGSRRTTGSFCLSMLIMVISSWLNHAIHLEPRWVVEAIAYGIHALGAVPFVIHAEPLWRILMAMPKEPLS